MGRQHCALLELTSIYLSSEILFNLTLWRGQLIVSASPARRATAWAREDPKQSFINSNMITRIVYTEFLLKSTINKHEYPFVSHTITMAEQLDIVCNENGCNTIFFKIESLRKHLISVHNLYHELLQKSNVNLINCTEHPSQKARNPKLQNPKPFLMKTEFRDNRNY